MRPILSVNKIKVKISIFVRLSTTSVPLEQGWKLCFDFLYQAGRNGYETSDARQASLPVEGRNATGDEINNCVVRQLPGTNRYYYKIESFDLSYRRKMRVSAYRLIALVFLRA